MRHMEIAWAELGVTETPGPAATSEIKQYFADAGRPDVVSDEVAWCAAFAGAVLARSGVDLTPIPKAERLLAVSYLKIGTAIAEPRVGAMAILQREDPGNKNAHHVGFVTRWSDSTVTLLGGNQADSVTEATFPRAAVVGYRWPAEEVDAAGLAAAGVKTIVVADRQQADATKAGAWTVSQPAMPQPPARIGFADWIGQLTGLKGAVSQAEAFALFAWSKWQWIAGAIAAYYVLRMAWDAGWIKDFRVKAANAGASPARRPAPKEIDDGSVV